MSDLFGRDSQWLKLCVPAVLYLVQNNLQYLAVTILDAATFQVTYQMKILTTALFSVIMLGKRLNRLKWLSLFILTAGIALVQLPTSSTSSTKRAASGPWYVQLSGLLAVAFACTLSGLAGVWFEKVLKGGGKGAEVSLWARNIQLSFFSVLPGFFIGGMFSVGQTLFMRSSGHGWGSISSGRILSGLHYVDVRCSAMSSPGRPHRRPSCQVC